MSRSGRHVINAARLAFACCSLLGAADSSASIAVYSGFLDDATNTALIGPELAPSAPSFTDDQAIADNSAVYAFFETFEGLVRFTSDGFASGGVDPFFTLFSGSGPGATFVASNDLQAFSTGGDFAIALSLPVGWYTFAIGSFANLSFAENLGSGKLGDGFIGFGEVGSLGNAFYRLTVTTPDGPGDGYAVPEPAPWMLLSSAGWTAWMVGRGRRRGVVRVPGAPHRFATVVPSRIMRSNRAKYPIPSFERLS